MDRPTFMRVIILASMVAPTAGFVACKPKPGSNEVKSLDELSGSSDSNKGDVGCSGPYSKASFLNEYPGLNTAYQQNIQRGSRSSEVETALSAVPNGLKAIYLGLGYELVYTNDLKAACKDANSKQSAVLDTLGASCAKSQLKSDAGHKSEVMTLFIADDSESIRNNTVLAMMGVISKKLGFIDSDDKGNTTLLTAETKAMSEFRTQLGVQVLHEGLSRNPESFKLISDVLPTEQAFYLKETTLEKRQELFTAFMRKEPTAANFALHDIFENTADSFYCNQKTQAALRDKYPDSAALFNQSIHADLDSDGGGLALRQSEDTNAELGLWWGARPLVWGQPVRNLFRARANQMSSNYQQTGFLRPRLAGFRQDYNRSWYQPPRWGTTHFASPQCRFNC